MRWGLLLLLALAACGPSRALLREPGVYPVHLEGSDDVEGLHQAIDIAVFAIADNIDWVDAEELRDKAAGWTVRVMRADSEGCWTDEWGREVCGLTYCRRQLIKVGTDNWGESSLAHELIHLAECPWNNVMHLGWDAPHYRAVYQAARAMGRGLTR